MEKIKIKQAVIVEGKYDKIKLESLIDALIIETCGFGIFKNKEKCALLRTLANSVGLLIITDSDVAGFKIRNYIKNITKGSANVHHIYIPQIQGKEKRKITPSKEGTLGVEGLDAALLRQLLERENIICEKPLKTTRQITRSDFIEDGLCGGENSSFKRKALLKRLDLPEYMSTNSLLSVINILISYEEYRAACTTVQPQNNSTAT